MDYYIYVKEKILFIGFVYFYLYSLWSKADFFILSKTYNELNTYNIITVAYSLDSPSHHISDVYESA